MPAYSLFTPPIMRLYNPEISTARLSTEKLQDRRELLANLGRSGNREQQMSQPRKAEMLRITLALHLRGVQPRSAAYVARPAGAKQYTAASRMYGLVDGHLLWAWDIAALGQELGSHASARLARVD